MFDWLRSWMSKAMERELSRLAQESRQLKEQIERETGKPIELTDEEREELAKLSAKINPETLAEISAFGTEPFLPSSEETTSQRKPTE